MNRDYKRTVNLISNITISLFLTVNGICLFCTHAMFLMQSQRSTRGSY